QTTLELPQRLYSTRWPAASRHSHNLMPPYRSRHAYPIVAAAATETAASAGRARRRMDRNAHIARGLPRAIVRGVHRPSRRQLPLQSVDLLGNFRVVL